LKISGRLVAFSLFVVLAGCSTQHYVRNLPLAGDASKPAGEPGTARYRIRDLNAEAGDEVLLFLSLSGGGMRAATLAYAVAEVLDDYRYERDGMSTSLLQEVDIVNSVSGGSLFAAWLGLHGADNFRAFEQVIASDLSSKVLWHWLSPRGLWVSNSSHYGRGDLLQEVLDEQVFHGKTFSDLTARARRPLLAIRATDISRGESFDFTQSTFDRLCSDVGPVPLARAVAASMAVPVLFSPITLQSFSRGCEVPGLNVTDTRSFVHLVDGGLVDNLGVRGPIDYIDDAGGFAEAARRNGLAKVKHVAFIVVNSETAAPHPEDEDGRTPGLLQSLGAWIDVPIARSTHENLNLLRSRIEVWRRELSSQLGLSDTQFHYAEVNFRSGADALELRRLNAIPTDLSVTPENAEALRRHARTRLEAEPGFQALIRALGARARSTSAGAAS